MASYKTLRAVFHQTKTNARAAVREELEQRLSNPATVQYPYEVGGEALFVLPHVELQVLLEDIWRRELAIEHLWGQLPIAAQTQYLFTLLVEEIRSSNEIENIHSTRQEIADALESSKQAAKKSRGQTHRRFQEMAGTYSVLFEEKAPASEGFPRTLQELRNLYDRLLGDEISHEDKLDGDLFRAGPVHIWDGDKKPIHSGVLGEAEIKARLSAMLDANRHPAGFDLIGAFVGHFMLEHTHPFYDGNGRFGRFLLALRLKALLSAPTAISLSAEMMRQKNTYYKAFKQLEDPMYKGEATFFVAHMLGFLASAQERLEDSLLEKWESLNRLRARIVRIQESKTGEFNSYQHHLFLLLGQVSLFGPRRGVKLDDATVFMDKSKATVRRELGALVEAGYLQELNRKPLVFALTDVGRELLGLDDASVAGP